MKIVFFSDTHGEHNNVTIPECDIAIFTGDLTRTGLRSQTTDFLDWFTEQDQAKYKVMIAGNHDYWFDINHRKSANYNITDGSQLDVIPNNITYLQDNSVTINGIKIWGSPITPWFWNWAFNVTPEVLETYWDKIPMDTDIVITHGPPANTILDICKTGDRAGCPSLYKRLLEVKPKICAFGHIHEGYGIEIIEDIKLINASILNVNYVPVNSPIEIEYK
jgi:Icc-related predicted phosphoesterase